MSPWRLRNGSLLVLAAVAVALSLAACSGSSSTPTPTATTTASPTATSSPTATQGATETATPQPTSTETVMTDVVTYVPETPAGGTAQQATCFTHSLAAQGRLDAWRCSIGNAIQDPCFLVDDTHLMCEPDPSKGAPGTYVVVDPTTSGSATEPFTPLGDRGAMAANAAWLLQLSDGTVCGFATGATGGNATQGRLNYSCTNQEWIIGDLIPGATYTAHFVTGGMGANGFEAKTDVIRPIATVWQ